MVNWAVLEHVYVLLLQSACVVDEGMVNVRTCPPPEFDGITFAWRVSEPPVGIGLVPPTIAGAPTSVKPEETVIEVGETVSDLTPVFETVNCTGNCCPCTALIGEEVTASAETLPQEKRFSTVIDCCCAAMDGANEPTTAYTERVEYVPSFLIKPAQFWTSRLPVTV